MQTQKIHNNQSSQQLNKGASSSGSKIKTNHRSTSEVKNQANETKLNYHYQQQRESSEEKTSARFNFNKPKNHFTIRKSNDSIIEDNKIKSIEFKLPDLKVHQKPPKVNDPLQISTTKSNSLIQQQQNQLRNRLNMYETKTSMMSASRMPKINMSKSEIPKLFLQSTSLSKAGFDGYNQKDNQDRDFVYCPIDGKYDQGAFAIFDGHGSEGDQVSQFLLEALRGILQKKFSDFDFKSSFQELHSLLIQNVAINTHFSGSTMTLCLLKNNQISCGWLGDSRAVLCRRNKQKRPLILEVIDLSKDHKPNLPEEKARIEASGGVVDSYHTMTGQQLGPHRVWVKGQPFPGLAMSRSLGDQVAASVGVSQIPEVTQFEITQDDIFMIVASDGIWEFISSQQQKAAEIVYPFYLKNDAQGACAKLYSESNQIWKQFDDGIDDITSIVVFFNHESP